MKDPEVIKLRNKFFLGVFLVVIFSVPLLFFVYKTYSNTNILSKINKGETFTILVVSDECESCEKVDAILKEKSVNYLELNSDRNKDYTEIMNKMTIINKREEFPIIIYVENGVMKANLFNLDTEEKVYDFLEYHKLVNLK